MEVKERTLNMSWKKAGKITVGVILGWSFWFCLMILALRWVNPSFTAFTLQEDWNALDKERYSLRENWVPANELPDHLKLAVVASEDQRFYEHWGLDLGAIEKALKEKELSGRVRGASTITQQVAKNLFLTSAQNYFRKGIEAGIAALIDFFWPKDRILEVYLNIAEFGPGMYGVNTASDFYYGKPAAQLSPKESARMATVLPNPKIIEPEPASEYVLNRSQWILRNMEQLSGLRYTPKPKPKPKPELEPDSLSSDSLFSIIRSDSISVVSPADTQFSASPDSTMF